MTTSRNKPRRRSKLLFSISVAGIALGIIALTAVFWKMSGYRTDVRDMIAASNNPDLAAAADAAISQEQFIMFGILAVTVLLTAINVGMEMFRQSGESGKKLKRFRATWKPVRVTKRVKAINQSFGSDFIRTKALGSLARGLVDLLARKTCC